MRRVVMAEAVTVQGSAVVGPCPEVLGLDLGFATCGWSILTMGREVSLADLGVWTTEKSPKKREVLSSHDDLRRAQELAGHLEGLLDARPNVRAVAVEAKSLPRNASAACKIGMAWGIFASAVKRRRLPVVQASPQEVRAALGLAKGASKLDVRTEVELRSGGRAKQVLDVAGVKEALREHPYDATAAGLACLDSEIVRAIRGPFRGG